MPRRKEKTTTWYGSNSRCGKITSATLSAWLSARLEEMLREKKIVSGIRIEASKYIDVGNEPIAALMGLCALPLAEACCRETVDIKSCVDWILTKSQEIDHVWLHYIWQLSKDHQPEKLRISVEVSRPSQPFQEELSNSEKQFREYISRAMAISGEKKREEVFRKALEVYLAKIETA